MKFSSILKILEFIKLVKERFQQNVFVYYDETEKEFCIAVTDIDFYWNQDFRSYKLKIREELDLSDVKVIQISEEEVKSSPFFGLWESISEGIYSYSWNKITASITDFENIYLSQKGDSINPKVKGASIFESSDRFNAQKRKNPFSDSGKGMPIPANSIGLIAA